MIWCIELETFDSLVVSYLLAVLNQVKAVYKDESLLLVNPRNKEGSLRYERWSEIPVLRQYCWNHLSNVEPIQFHKCDQCNQSLQFQYRNFTIYGILYTFYETYIHEIYRIKIQQKFLSIYHGNDSHCNVLSTSQLEIYKFKSTRKYFNICD